MISYYWLDPLMILGYKKPLTMGDLWALNPRDDAEFVSAKFEGYWESELKKEK